MLKSRCLIAVCLFAQLFGASLCSSANATDDARALITAGYRQLFLDDAMVAEIDGLRRVVHQPKKYKENPIIRHHQTPWQGFRAQLYGTVLYIPAEKKFKMWYLSGARFPDEEPIRVNGRLVCPNFQLLAYAESDNGFHWRLPELGLVDFNGSKENNLCRISRENAEGVGVLYDPHDPDAQRRYKAFYWEHDNCGPRQFDPTTPVNAMSVSFSPDGKSWTDHPGNPVIPQPSDTGHQALYDSHLGKYVVYGRFGAGGRKVARSESDDFVHWTPSKRVFETDAEDGPGAQFYGMGTTIYEGVYVGLPWMYWAETTQRMDVQLATSRDGIHWERAGDRQTFMPNGPKGSWDGGCIFTAAQPVQRVGDKIFIFYSALKLTHEEERPSRQERGSYGESSIGVATLRRDGFLSLTPYFHEGSITTKPLSLPEGTLRVNADVADDGEVRVTVLGEDGVVLAESQPVSGDQLDAAVSFDKPLPVGHTVSLRFVLRKSHLYAYWFTKQGRISR